MRIVTLMVAAGLAGCSGCSFLVHGAGKDLNAIHTREEARAAFGPPRASGEVEGRPYDEFTTHHKISRHEGGEYAIFAFAGTLGLSELIAFPHAVYVAARRSIDGQPLRFIYGVDGKVLVVEDEYLKSDLDTIMGRMRAETALRNAAGADHQGGRD